MNVHRRTPALTVHDSRGLPVRLVEYLRQVAGEAAQALVSRHLHDLAGRLVTQRDPRLFDGASPPNLQTIYTLDARPLWVDSVDAGWRLMLPGLGGEERQRWNQRGNHWQYEHDLLLRVIAITENAQARTECYTYADHNANAGFNLRGSLTTQTDPSGNVVFGSYSLLGQGMSETRTFADATGTFTTQRHYDPLGNVLQLTDAGGHRQQSQYDVAGQLQQLSLQLAGSDTAQPVVSETRYNADGQLIEQLAGNGVRRSRHYDPADGRLLHLLAYKDPAAPLQDLHYVYDPAGNILSIEDHTLATVYFANQRVDGNRHFVYDSFYRLIESRGFEGETPQQSPGLPQPIQPIDPGRRFNYREHYRHDEGNNLVELQHVREGHNFTQQMIIDPHSNRGVRWKTGDPEPVFAEHFDLHGNQLRLQPGTQPLLWDNRDQLARATLLQHSNGLPDDKEIYRYSQGERVYKCSLSHTPSVTHRREVLYLPGLEIHARSDGQHLHVIVLPGARCLHWLSGRPPELEEDQLRYSLDDHLGSCALELDHRAGVISLEHYYPFGGTAWWAARSALEASYKTIRYSGQEMDASGLYYYGARYYAPWLQRWISADPAGDVDGLNLYAFVGNNPTGFIDADGQALTDFLQPETREEHDLRKARGAEQNRLRRARVELSSQVERHLNILALSLRRGLDAQQQILNHRTTSDFAGSTLRRGATHITGQVFAYGGAIAVGIGAQALGAAAPGVGNVAGVVIGFAAKKTISLLWDYAAERTGASASIKFKASRVSAEKIIKKAEYKTMSPLNYIEQKYAKMLPDTQKGALKGLKESTSTAISLGAKQITPSMAAEVSATASTLLGAVEIGHEIAGAVGDLTAEKIAQGERNLTGLIDALQGNLSKVANYFETAGVNAIHTFGLFKDSPGDSVESLTQTTQAVINELAYARTMLRSHSHKFSHV